MLLLVTIFAFGLFGFFLRSARQTKLAAVALYAFVTLLGVSIGYLIAESTELNWSAFGLSILISVASGYVIAWLINLQFVPASIMRGFGIVFGRIISDFRVAAVIIALILSCILTYYFAQIYNLQKSTFWESFFASWTSGLLFFTVVGLVAGLVTLYRPEHDVFHARVKILLGGKSGAFVDYIGEQIRGVGYIARKVEREVTVEGYDPSRKSFKIRMRHKGHLRNVLEDVEAIAKGRLTIVPDKIEPKPDVLGEVVSLQLSGTDLPSLPLHIEGEKGFDQSWELPVPPKIEAVVDYEYWAWVLETEIHTFALARFAEEVSLTIKCRCNTNGKKLSIKLTTPSESTEHALDWNGTCSFKSPLTNLKAGVQVYSFKVGLQP